tara:strand:- start:8198 stop:8830 length:633 start_codon:yes stop_codon:yes gene_type:complete
VAVVDLADVETHVIARVLNERLDGVSFLPDGVYELFAEHSIMPCVDGFPVQMGPEVPEMLFIRRETGKYTGFWWCVGGLVKVFVEETGEGESLSTAMIRHFQSTLGVGIVLPQGCAWNKPVMVAQHAPYELDVAEGEFAGDEPSKHCISPTFLVKLQSQDFEFGTGADGRKEAGDFRWFPVDALPPDEEIAYRGQNTVRVMAEACRTLFS